MSEERIWVVCDKCSKPAPSGLIVDAEGIEDLSDKFGENRTNCPSCGHWIVWSKAKVWPESVIQQRFGKRSIIE